MATVVNEPVRIARGALPKYPWHEWLDGRAWRLVRGEDFPAHRSASSFRKQIQNKGDYVKLYVATRLVEHEGKEAILIQAFTYDNDPRRATPRNVGR